MDLLSLEAGAWACLFLPLFLMGGVLVAIKTRMFPLRGLPLLRKELAEDRDKGDGLGSGQAASLSLAATIGTGNIIGTAQAIAMGGPGAVAWMWLAALIGMPIKYAEIFLGQRYPGGAIRYVTLALGPIAGTCYAALGALSALAVGNMAQVNGTVTAIAAAIGAGGKLCRFILGLSLCACLWRVLAGGARRAGKAAELLVPAMTLIFLFFSFAVIVAHGEQILPTLRQIVQGALSPRSALGAACGIQTRETLQWGLRRGAFSNEAGLGTASIVHSAVRAKDAAVHALCGVFEVMVDTWVVCTVTALTILCSGIPIPYGSLPGPELYRDALASVWGQRTASLVLSASLALFSFTTVLGSFVTGRRCFSALCGERVGDIYLGLSIACALLGSVIPIGPIWRASDSIDLALAVPALIALVVFSGEIGRSARERSHAEKNARYPERPSSSIRRPSVE